MRFFLVHGAYGSPEENWFPWLKRELEAMGHEAAAPCFPTPENQSLGSWLDAFKSHRGKADGSVFIAHSLGHLLC